MDNTCSPCKNISKSTAYGTAYSFFYADMLRTGVLLFGDGFDREFSMEILFLIIF